MHWSIRIDPFHRREIHPFKEKRRKEIERWLWIG